MDQIERTVSLAFETAVSEILSDLTLDGVHRLGHLGGSGTSVDMDWTAIAAELPAEAMSAIVGNICHKYRVMIETERLMENARR